MTDQETITVVYDWIDHTTDKAILFFFGDDEIWLPKSQITDLDEVANTVEIPLWLAEEKEIEDYEY